MTPDECRYETLKHRDKVKNLVSYFCNKLMDAAEVHDQSKLHSPELETFVEFTPKLKGSTYGSDEYKGFLKSMKVALDHHYEFNRHHPEHFSTYYCSVCCEHFEEAFVPKAGPCQGMTLCPKCCNGTPDEHWKMTKMPNVDKMNLVDIVEMLCDWKAASMRHDDGDIMSSIKKNGPRFGISHQLLCILKNTIEMMEN